MGRRHYELGVSLYRRRPFFALPSVWFAGFVTVLMMIGIGSAGVIPGLPGITGMNTNGNTDDSEQAHRQNKYGHYAASQNYDDDTKGTHHSGWLRVRQATNTVPTAAPSPSQPAASSGAVATWNDNGNLIANGTVPSSMQTDNESTGQTTIAGAGDGQPASNLPVQPVIGSMSDNPATDALDTPIAAAEQKITVSVVNPVLPAISLPVTIATGLDDPAKKDFAMQLVSSAENSSTDWKAQYGYIEDIRDGRGYTAGIIGFCSGTGDMLELVQYYTKLKPGNVLAKYIAPLQKLNGSDSHAGLDPDFVRDWKIAAADTTFQKAQNDERDRVYFNPAVQLAKADKLRTLGQFIYYDAIVMHGPGDEAVSFGGIRAAAMKKSKTPAQGGDEATYLNAFLDARVAAMKQEAAHEDVSRVETAQRVFLKAGNFDLNGPLSWKVYGESYTIR